MNPGMDMDMVIALETAYADGYEAGRQAMLSEEEEKMDKKILDATCGSRMMWFNKQHPDALYMDKRVVDDEIIWEAKDGTERRKLTVKPDVVADFTAMPFADESFYLVVFDPPHIARCGETSWLAKKYGRLEDGWQETIRKGFQECMRVLKQNGVLIFKWSEKDVKVREVLDVIGEEPLFGHVTGKSGHTIWMTFMKGCNS